MKELNIIHEKDFKEDFYYYKVKYPETHTSFESIKTELIEDEELYCNKGMFGIKVSSDNEDRCYFFEHITSTQNEVFYEYMGTGKC